MNLHLTRRHMSLLLGGLGIGSAAAQSQTHSTAIHQNVEFKAKPERIYAVLMDAQQFSAFTKQPAEIQAQPGEAFRLFGRRIEGRNIELIPNRRIVQAWRSAGWPAGLYSIVRFELIANGTGTQVALDHTGFTEEKWEHLNDGWSLNYWEPLRKYLES